VAKYEPTDTEKQEPALQSGIVSRRSFLAATAGIAAVGCEPMDPQAASERISAAEATGAEITGTTPQAPFDTLRAYVAALEAHGLLLRFDKVDQDAFEGAAIIYALIDKYGWYDAPAGLF